MIAPKEVLTLVLVRHGESTWNASKLVQGQNDEAKLTEKGRNQALSAAETLRDQHFDAILASDLQRASETAGIIAEVLGLEVETTPSLRERSFGVLEGGPWGELASDLTGIEGDVVISACARPAGGESLEDVRGRVAALVDELADTRPQGRVLLVTHGGPIRAIRAYVAGVDMQGLEWDRVANTSVWTLTIEGQASSD